MFTKEQNEMLVSTLIRKIMDIDYQSFKLYTETDNHGYILITVSNKYGKYSMFSLNSDSLLEAYSHLKSRKLLHEEKGLGQ